MMDGFKFGGPAGAARVHGHGAAAIAMTAGAASQPASQPASLLQLTNLSLACEKRIAKAPATNHRQRIQYCDKVRDKARDTDTTHRLTARTPPATRRRDKQTYITACT